MDHVIGIDTNILAYALDKASVQHKASVNFLSKCLKEQVSIAIAHQTVPELINVFVNRFGQKAPYITAKLEILIEELDIRICYPRNDTISVFYELANNLGIKKRTFDIFLAAQFIDHKIKQIYTFNTKDFQNIPGLKAVRP